MTWNRDFKITMTLVVLLAVAGAVFIFLYSGKDDETQYIPRPVAMTAEIQQLQDYIRIDTTSGHEMAGAQFFHALLQKNGVQSELIESAPGKGNVYARIRGKRPGEALLLLHHIDVVPADASEWSRPPFDGDIVLHWLIGRGALDMKSIGIIEAAAFIELAKSGKTPERDVVLLATADEESGGALGLGWILEHRPDVLEGVRYAVNEGGITETRSEKINYFAVEVGSKSFSIVTVSAPTEEVIDRVEKTIAPYGVLAEPDRVLPQVREYFESVAPHRIEPRELLVDIDKTIREGNFSKLHESYRVLTQNTARTASKRKTADGWAVNVILANLPDEAPEPRIEWLRRLLKDEPVTLVPVLMMPKLSISSTDTPFFRLLARRIRAEYGEDIAVGPLLISKVSTDCRHLRSRGVSCYGLWPFPVDFSQTGGIHGPDERVRLDWYMEGVSMMRALVMEYATADQLR